MLKTCLPRILNNLTVDFPFGKPIIFIVFAFDLKILTEAKFKLSSTLKALFEELMLKQLKPAAQGLMAAYDANKDGAVTLEEFMPADLAMGEE